MTRLDENRARSQLAKKAGVLIQDVKNVCIWGNHSSTQVPDALHATINNSAVKDVIQDKNWLEKAFITTVQKRGAEVIAARGKSSAASAANAIIDTIKSLYEPTPQGGWYSVALSSDGNTYGVEEGLVFSFPCQTLSNGKIAVVNDLHLDLFLKEKIKVTQQELLEEKTLINHLL